MTPHYLTVPDHIRGVDTGKTIVLVDIHRGSTQALVGHARQLWLTHILNQQEYQEKPGTLDHTVVQQLCTLGLVRLSTRPHIPPTMPLVAASQSSWGTHTVPVRLDDETSHDKHRSLPAILGLLITLGVLHTGKASRGLQRLTRLVQCATARAPANVTTSEAEAAIAAVRHTARFWPVRVACLEESAAATVALALTGRRATWCHGLAADPIALHAWIEVNSTPVAEPLSTQRFSPVLHINGEPTER
jgi:hypothetical protein